nr:hypothetical protein [Tanacetum cinerariifolium]
SSSSQLQKTKKHRKPKKKNTQVPQPSGSTKHVADEAVYKKLARIYSSKDEQILGEDASKQERNIDDIDADEDITLVNDQDDFEMFNVNDLHGEEVFVEKEVADRDDDVQAKIDADYELAQRIQAKEQDELTDAEKTKLFMQFLKKRRKFFAAKRAEEKRNRPPTRAQQRSIMSMKKVNTFVDFKTKLVEESSKKAEAEITQEDSLKRAGDELGQERSKKQKVKDDKESKELKKCLEIIPDDRDDVTIDATPLSSNKMLKFFDREDLEVLWRLFKARFEKIKQVDHVD